MIGWCSSNHSVIGEYATRYFAHTERHGALAHYFDFCVLLHAESAECFSEALTGKLWKG